MTLPSDQLEDFKQTYENAFGVRLSDDEARDLAERLKELYRTILRRSASAGEEARPVAPPWETRDDLTADPPAV